MPVDGVWAVWESFHGTAEGFGIGEEETLEILSALQASLGLTRGRLARLSRGLFRRLDTDDNGLIDSLEMLVCLSAISSMLPAQRVECEFQEAAILQRSPRTLASRGFGCAFASTVLSLALPTAAVLVKVYDFDETGELSFDEAVLATRTLAVGLSKLTLTTPPTEAAVEAVIAAVSPLSHGAVVFHSRELLPTELCTCNGLCAAGVSGHSSPCFDRPSRRRHV